MIKSKRSSRSEEESVVTDEEADKLLQEAKVSAETAKLEAEKQAALEAEVERQNALKAAEEAEIEAAKKTEVETESTE